jgi:hypothetical protein
MLLRSDTYDTRPRFSLGISGGLVVVLHGANFLQLSTVSNGLTPFSVVSPNPLASFHGEIFAEIPWQYFTGESLPDADDEWRVNLQLRAAYQRYNAMLRSLDSSLVGYANGAPPSMGRFERVLESCLAAVHLEAMVVLQPPAESDIANLRLYAGLRSGVMVDKRFYQVERLLAPNDVVFANGLRTRNEQEGIIPESTVVPLAITIGAGYSLVRTGKIAITPEVFISPAVIPVANSTAWFLHTARVLVAVSYTF